MRFLFFTILILAAAPLRAQELTLQVESEDLYANLPFILQVAATGFDEAPEPTLSRLEIAGCRVTSLGMTPSVSTMLQILGGRRSESRSVTFVYRFRVEAPRPGHYTVPALVAEQGKRRAQSRPARLSVRPIEETRDMQVRLALPERPMWVGETFDAQLEWYLRRDVSNRTFVVPLFDEDFVDVEPAPAGAQKLGGFHAGARQLELPYERDSATLDGERYTRFRFLLRITPTRPGTLRADPPRVIAELSSGTGRDVFGFAVPVTRLYQAVGKPVTLLVKPPPLAGRPPSFRNAVGSAFSLDVQAGRTVLRVGDPIDLRLLLRGRGRLSGLMLPPLSAMGLLPEHFALPDEVAAGELLDEGGAKLFRVTVRLKRGGVKQVPALSFSYFDPERGAYETVRSQPIALSVEGSAVVGAGEVVGGAPSRSRADTPPGSSHPAAEQAAGPGVSLSGADLSLSQEGATLGRARSLRDVLAWLVLLYTLPLGVLATAVWRLRSQERRRAVEGLRRAMKALEREVADAEGAPARQAAPRVAQALRALMRQRGDTTPEGRALLERLETEAYSQEAGEHPLPPPLREEARRLARVLSGMALFAALALELLTPRPAAAQDADARLRAARTAYAEALASGDRDRRRAGFARAEALFRELATELPDRPELLSDWGNAALSAQEPGRAVLAYRRALRLRPTEERALRNLAFLRARMPEWLPRPPAGALDALFFWQGYLSVAEQHLLMGLFFGVAVLLAAPLSTSAARRRVMRGVAIAPAFLWAAMAASLLIAADDAADAVVVMDEVVLRSADNLGAPPALGRTLPAGAEVRVREVRGGWTRIHLWNGQGGWVPSSALERVRP